MTCSVEGCDRPIKGRGMCNLHYTRFRQGRPLDALPRSEWDGNCKRCGSAAGPFYGRSQVCGPCNHAARRVAEKAPGPRRDAALERARRYAKKSHAERRQRIITAYGGACRCCGEREPVFLAVDHVGGDGNVHRRENKFGGTPGFYRWIEKNDYPNTLQLLCHNCNYAKSQGGCPHAR